MDWSGIETLIEEIIELQKTTLLRNAKEIVPHIVLDDLLQPNDFIQLENNPLFRYEEGVLTGMQTIATALRALKKQN